MKTSEISAVKMFFDKLIEFKFLSVPGVWDILSKEHGICGCAWDSKSQESCSSRDAPATSIHRWPSSIGRSLQNFLGLCKSTSVVQYYGRELESIGRINLVPMHAVEPNLL